MPDKGKKMVHGSVGSMSKYKRQPDSGAEGKHGSMGCKYDKAPPKAPNNPNATASGKPKNYEGGPGKFQRPAKNMTYAQGPKKGK